jgi:hypothetical protein
VSDRVVYCTVKAAAAAPEWLRKHAGRIVVTLPNGDIILRCYESELEKVEGRQ